MRLASMTLDATRATLSGVALFQAVAAIVAAQRGTDARAAKANAIGAAVCLIAASVYQRMTSTSGAVVDDLRHADWLVTCPLMLWELYVLIGIDARAFAPSFGVSVVAIVVCILLGRVAVERTGGTRVLFYALATAAFAVTLANVGLNVDWSRAKSVVPYAFLLVWALYPLAFWEKSGSAYNVLDIVTKGVFGLYVGASAF